MRDYFVAMSAFVAAITSLAISASLVGISTGFPTVELSLVGIITALLAIAESQQ